VLRRLRHECGEPPILVADAALGGVLLLARRDEGRGGNRSEEQAPEAGQQEADARGDGQDEFPVRTIQTLTLGTEPARL